MVTQIKVSLLETGKWDAKLLYGPEPTMDDTHVNFPNKGGGHHPFVLGNDMGPREARSQRQCHR